MNRAVLVTRPFEQGLEFIDLLKERDIKALSFPCIEIQPVELSDLLKRLFQSLGQYQLIIFISANAVQQAAAILHRLNIAPSAIDAKIATIGKATLAAARKLGFKVDLSPDKGFNSDALLALDALQADKVKGMSCLIVRGVGGLNTLADELTLRGVKVAYAEVYRRHKPVVDKGLSRQQLSEHWEHFNIAFVSVTSNESIQNLYDMLFKVGAIRLLETPLIVVSERGVKLAQSLGFKTIKLAASAMNQHILDVIEIEFKEIQ